MNTISLVKETITKNEIDSLVQWLSDYPRLTQGPLVKEFEKKWSEFIKVEHSAFVNSGSSALLVAYYAIFILTGRKNFIVPALSWATDLAPIIQFGLNPILCDCNMDDLSLDLDHLELLLQENSDCVVNLVSVLGLVPNMERVKDLKDKYQFVLIEDVCESFGSSFNSCRLGSLGDVSVFSLFYGHHLSTIEGGMICTNNDDLNDIIKMIRSHGWDRELESNKQNLLRQKYNINDFSASYTFYYPGFNVRATDLQAFIGISQLNNANQIITKRNENYHYYVENLKLEWKPTQSSRQYVSNFCYPVITQKRDLLARTLIENNIECRPLICGSMGTQPFYTDVYKKQILKNASLVDSWGMYIPNNPDLTKEEMDRIIDAVNSVID